MATDPCFLSRRRRPRGLRPCMVDDAKAFNALGGGEIIEKSALKSAFAHSAAVRSTGFCGLAAKWTPARRKGPAGAPGARPRRRTERKLMSAHRRCWPRHPRAHAGPLLVNIGLPSSRSPTRCSFEGSCSRRCPSQQDAWRTQVYRWLEMQDPAGGFRRSSSTAVIHQFLTLALVAHDADR